MTLTAAAPASPEQIIVHALSVRACRGHWAKGPAVHVRSTKQFLSHSDVTLLKILKTENLGGLCIVFKMQPQGASERSLVSEF